MAAGGMKDQMKMVYVFVIRSVDYLRQERYCEDFGFHLHI